eukprot:m.84784 g.84784  ORF g.84784 m.84784 type:complete len:775 (-) comp12761_c0_seq9:47-2371(-)
MSRNTAKRAAAVDNVDAVSSPAAEDETLSQDLLALLELHQPFSTSEILRRDYAQFALAHCDVLLLHRALNEHRRKHGSSFMHRNLSYVPTTPARQQRDTCAESVSRGLLVNQIDTVHESRRISLDNTELQFMTSSTVRCRFLFLYGPRNIFYQEQVVNDGRCPLCTRPCRAHYSLLKHMTICHPRYSMAYSIDAQGTPCVLLETKKRWQRTPAVHDPSGSHASSTVCVDSDAVSVAPHPSAAPRITSIRETSTPVMSVRGSLTRPMSKRFGESSDLDCMRDCDQDASIVKANASAMSVTSTSETEISTRPPQRCGSATSTALSEASTTVDSSRSSSPLLVTIPRPTKMGGMRIPRPHLRSGLSTSVSTGDVPSAKRSCSHYPQQQQQLSHLLSPHEYTLKDPLDLKHTRRMSPKPVSLLRKEGHELQDVVSITDEATPQNTAKTTTTTTTTVTSASMSDATRIASIKGRYASVSEKFNEVEQRDSAIGTIGAIESETKPAPMPIVPTSAPAIQVDRVSPTSPLRLRFVVQTEESTSVDSVSTKEGFEVINHVDVKGTAHTACTDSSEDGKQSVCYTKRGVVMPPTQIKARYKTKAVRSKEFFFHSKQAPRFTFAEFAKHAYTDANGRPVAKKSRALTEQDRVFFSSRHFTSDDNIKLDAQVVDSDDEVEQDWLTTTQEKMLDEFIDVNVGEKAFMKLWNRCCQETRQRDTSMLVADSNVYSFVCDFWRQHRSVLVHDKLVVNFKIHLHVLCRFGLLSPKQVVSLSKLVSEAASA